MFSRTIRLSQPTVACTRVPIMARQFHGSPIARETVGEKVRELGHKVNMKVGKGLASAIDTGEKVTHATKEKLATDTESVERNIEEGKEKAGKKANDVAEGAQKAKEDFKRELEK